MATILQLAKVPQTSVSMKEMVQFGRIPSKQNVFRGCQFLLNELPVRLSHRVVELDNLPHGLSKMPSVIKVKDWYSQSAEELLALKNDVAFPPHENTTLKYFNNFPRDRELDIHEITSVNDKFLRCIDKIKKRHDPTTQTLAQGILELKDHWKLTNSPLHHEADEEHPLPTAIQKFMDRFYSSRIGIRMLLGQHIALTAASKDARSIADNYVGIICTKTNLSSVAEDAVANARMLCAEYYGLYESPPIKIMVYVPSHLHHILFELLKNSLRAVVERYGQDCDEYPEIRLIIAQGKEDITIKISDEGGGIPRSGIPLIWSYLYTTAENPLLQSDDSRNEFAVPLAGYGYGLPLSRLYARYFGGDLRIISMDGFGTDAFIHLSRLSDSDEPLY